MVSKVNEYITYTISGIILICYLSLLIFGLVCLVDNFNEFNNLKTIWYYCLVNVITFLVIAIKFNILSFMIKECFSIVFILNTSLLIWGYHELFVFNSKINSNISIFTLITFIVYSIFELIFLTYLLLHCYAKLCLLKTPCCCLFNKCRDKDDISDDIELQNLRES